MEEFLQECEIALPFLDGGMKILSKFPTINTLLAKCNMLTSL